MQNQFLTSEFIAPLIENDPNLIKVYKFNVNKKDNLFYLIKLGVKIAKRKFDIAINSLIPLKIKIILAFVNPKQVLYRSKTEVHAIDRFLDGAKNVFKDVQKPEKLKLYIKDEVINSIQLKTKVFKTFYCY
ncbi:MAG: hypothetical protein MZV70_76295 [Desulfobacterales bacterium]|nr:hypothetical protein [Desulfobacterales bacterium]